MFLADPGEARDCFTNTFVIHSLILCENMFTALHALLVEDGSFSHLKMHSNPITG